MKTRLVILIAIALLAAACSSSDAVTNTGLTRTTVAESPTTTSGGSDTSIDGALPTNPDTTTGNSQVTLPIQVEPCDPPTEDLAAYCQPFELVLGNTRIVWDRWFWGQGTFSKGSVEVYHGDELVAAGPFVGEGSIVEQDEDNNFVFYDADGTVVAIASPDDITPAIQAVLDDLNG
jgi:hypothetical protein